MIGLQAGVVYAVARCGQLAVTTFRYALLLMTHGIRYARSDYWTAYVITFLAGERVVVASTEVVSGMYWSCPDQR